MEAERAGEAENGKHERKKKLLRGKEQTAKVDGVRELAGADWDSSG